MDCSKTNCSVQTKSFIFDNSGLHNLNIFTFPEGKYTTDTTTTDMLKSSFQNSLNVFHEIALVHFFGGITEKTNNVQIWNIDKKHYNTVSK